MNNQNDMKKLTVGLSTKSDKIRALGKAGYARQQIADFLGIRYQHVRNVLVDAEKKETVRELAEPQTRWRSEQVDEEESGKIRVQTNGSVVIPASLLEGAGFKPGDRVLSFVKGNGEIHLLSRLSAIRRAQELVRKYVPEGVDLVDELIADRRREAEKEGWDALHDHDE